MRRDEIEGRIAQGRRVVAEEREYVSDCQQEDKRMEEEANRPKPATGDFRVTVMGLPGVYDMSASIRKNRLEFELYHYQTKTWRRPTSSFAWEIAKPYAQAACHWYGGDVIDRLSGLDNWLAPRLVRHEEVEPGVWEFDVEKRSSD